MRFHFCLFNHPNSHDTLNDMRVWFAAGLRALGHTVTESLDQVDASAFNVLWERFSPGQGAELRRLGIKYGIVATEIPVGATFNGRTDGEWGARWAGFVEAAEGASFIWTMLESAIPSYAHLAPTAFVELGYVGELVDRSPHASTHDFSFLGSPRPYREAIVSQLSRNASVYWPRACIPWSEMAGALRRGRLALALKIDETWPLPSAARLVRLVHARVGIAMDYTPVTTRQSAPIPQCAEDSDFVSYALERLSSYHGSSEADDILEHYRTNLPMHGIMERVLDLTLSAHQP